MSRFNDLIEAQGWTLETWLFIVLEFINSEGLQDNLESFATEIAEAENAL